MTRATKTVLALLIALSLCGIVTFLAFTNLFSLIELNIYLPNIKKTVEQEMTRYNQAIEKYQAELLSRLMTISHADYVYNSFEERLSADFIQRQELAFQNLLASKLGLTAVRLLDPLGQKIHYSTIQTDLELASSNLKRYRLLYQIDPVLHSFNLKIDKNQEPFIIYDGRLQRFIVVCPVINPQDDLKGSALYFFKASELEKTLISQFGLFYREMRLIDKAGLCFDLAGIYKLLQADKDIDYLEKSIAEILAKSQSKQFNFEMLKLKYRDELKRVVVYSLSLAEHTKVAFLYDAEYFEVGWPLKTIVLLIIYITLTLIIFIIFNLRQEPIIVVAKRMQQFQVEFLREFFEKKDQLDLSHWKAELDKRREELKRYMKKGLPKLPAGKETEIDNFIMNSWNEVATIIKSKLQQTDEEKTELKQIELLLRKILAEGKIILPTQPELQAKIASKSGFFDAAVQEQPQTKEIEVAPVEEVEELQGLESQTVSEKGEELTLAKENQEATKLHELSEVAELEEVTELLAVTEEELPQGSDQPNIEKTKSPDIPTLAKEAEELLPSDSTEVEELPGVNDLPPQVAALPGSEALVKSTDKTAAAISAQASAEVEELEAVEIELPLADKEEASTEIIELKEIKDEEIKGAVSGDEEKETEIVEELEVVPEIKPLPPLETEVLDELPQVEEEEKRILEEKTFKEEFETACKRQEIILYYLEDLIAEYKRATQNIILEEDGVYRIKPELYQTTKTLYKNKGLKALAEAILEKAQTSQQPTASIETLFSHVPTLLDLSEENALAKSENSAAFKNLKIKLEIPLISQGLDLDTYLDNYKYPISDKVIIHSLGEIIKKSKAVSAGIISCDPEVRLSLAIGLTASSVNQFKLEANNFFVQEYLKNRMVILISGVFAKLGLFKKSLTQDDMRFIRSAVFFPLILEKRQDYLFLGFPSVFPTKSLISFLKNLNVTIANE